MARRKVYSIVDPDHPCTDWRGHVYYRSSRQVFNYPLILLCSRNHSESVFICFPVAWILLRGEVILVKRMILWHFLTGFYHVLSLQSSKSTPEEAEALS